MDHVSRRQFLTTSRRPRRHPRHPDPARAGPAARDLLPLLEQLRARLGQEAGRDRPALHQGHRHQDQDRPHLPGPQQAASTPPRSRRRPGHDLVEMRMHFPWLYEPQLVGRLRRRGRDREEVRQGDPLGQGGGHVKGVWRAVPQYHAIFVAAYREDLFKKASLKVPDTWEDLYTVGKELKKMGQPGRDPHQPELRLDLDGGARAVVVRRHGGRQGRQDGQDQLAGAPCRWSSGTRRCTRTAWSPRSCRGPTPATTSRSSRARPAGSTTRSAPTSWPATAKLVTADGINHHRSLAGPNGPPRDRRAAPHRHLEVLEEHRAVQGVDPLPARQEGSLRRVHHVGRRLQPAGLREAAGPPGAEDRSEVRRRSRAKACSTTATAGRRRPATRSSSSPTRSSCPT